MEMCSLQKNLNEAELLYPQSEWAPKAALRQFILIIHKIIFLMRV